MAANHPPQDRGGAESFLLFEGPHRVGVSQPTGWVVTSARRNRDRRRRPASRTSFLLHIAPAGAHRHGTRSRPSGREFSCSGMVFLSNRTLHFLRGIQVLEPSSASGGENGTRVRVLDACPRRGPHRAGRTATNAAVGRERDRAAAPRRGWGMRRGRLAAARLMRPGSSRRCREMQVLLVETRRPATRST